MGTVRWKLREYLEAHNLTPYRLAQTLDSSKAPNIYRLTKKGSPPTMIGLNNLGNIIDNLRDLTGEAVSVCDVLEFEEHDDPRA